MNRTNLVEWLATDLRVSKDQARYLLDRVLTGIEEGVRRDRQLVLTGFGTFVLRATPAREGRSPQTGQRVHIPAHSRLAFRASPVIRRRLP